MHIKLYIEYVYIYRYLQLEAAPLDVLDEVGSYLLLQPDCVYVYVCMYVCRW